MIVSFDFDDTLCRNGRPLQSVVDLLHSHAQHGDRILIVTSRTEEHESPSWWKLHAPDRLCVVDFITSQRLPVSGIVFTSHEPKARFLVERRVDLHYDNDPTEVLLARHAGVKAILVESSITSAGALAARTRFVNDATRHTHDHSEKKPPHGCRPK